MYNLCEATGFLTTVRFLEKVQAAAKGKESWELTWDR